MMVCGPTVQGYVHVGNAKTYLFYDLLARYLAHLDYEVSFVLNITDVDEAIVKGAKAAGVATEAFVRKYEQAFLEDMRALRMESVSSYDRVSSHIPEIMAQVDGLLSTKSAYHAGTGVYFSVDSFPRFGRLSRQTHHQISLRPLEIGAGKRNQADFSLWRAGAEEEQKWDSPWGRGTPGWHVQDTAVSFSHFGPQYDIHGGARELIYPHHEAQIAQMESLTGKRPFVRYWIHTGLLTQRKEKMAKSKGNVLRLRDALRDYGPDALRLYLLSMKHREDAEFSIDELSCWRDRYWDLREKARSLAGAGRGGRHDGVALARFYSAMDDDLSSNRAVRHLVSSIGGGEPGALELATKAAPILGVSFHGTG